MSEAGYTLTETLAAMAVIGMAIGGLTFGVQVLSPLQRSASSEVARAEAVRATQARLERLLALGAPYSSQSPARFSGDALNFKFACGAPQPCRVEVRADARAARFQITDRSGLITKASIPASGEIHFQYRGSGEPSSVWPPAAPGRQALRSVALLQGNDVDAVAVLETRVWAEQPVRCSFDPVMQDCW